MTNDLNIEDALTAYFNQPNGPSRPGIDFAIRIEGDNPAKVIVRTYFSSDPPQAVEQGMMAAKAIFFLRDKLASGWPAKEGFLEVTD